MTMAAEDEIAKTTGNLLQQLVGPWVIEKGLTWGENARIERLKNEFTVLEKAKKIVDEQGVKLKNIDLKALVPLLEGMGLEEDDELQDMWANLFVNYIDSKKNMQVIVYPTILRQLSSKQVQILDRLFFPEDAGVSLEPVNFKQLIEHTDYGYEAMTHLENIGLIKLTGEDEDRFNENYSLTFFGANFLKACKRIKKSS